MLIKLPEFIPKVFAEDSVIGRVINPFKPGYGDITTPNAGLGLLITNFLKLFFMVAGIAAFLNFMIAGFEYMMSGGDPKKLTSAWNKIWFSLLGLILMAGSFAIAALFGYLIFKDPLFMFHPQVFGPN